MLSIVKLEPRETEKTERVRVLRSLLGDLESGLVTDFVAVGMGPDTYMYAYGASPETSVMLSSLLQRVCVDGLLDALGPISSVGLGEGSDGSVRESGELSDDASGDDEDLRDDGHRADEGSAEQAGEGHKE